MSPEDKVASQSRGPLTQSKPQVAVARNAATVNPMFRNQTPEARNRQAALEAYTDTRSQSVVARVAQIEVEGLRRRENVPVDEEALQNYAYQDNDTSFQEANFARLNRYISANHNDIYVKALRNKASSLVGENGQNITPRMFPNQGTTGGAFAGQSSSYLGGIRVNKNTNPSYPSYRSFASDSGDAVVSKRIAIDGGAKALAFVTAQQAKRMQQQASLENKISPIQAQNQAARLALEAQQRAQKIAEQQFAAQIPVSEDDEESDRVLVQNNNTCIVSNSPLATAEYENSERLYAEEVAAAASKSNADEENYGPRTVISVHENTPGHVPDELVEMDYVYSDDEIQAPDFLTEDVSWKDETQDDAQAETQDDAQVEDQADESTSATTVVYASPEGNTLDSEPQEAGETLEPVVESEYARVASVETEAAESAAVEASVEDNEVVQDSVAPVDPEAAAQVVDTTEQANEASEVTQPRVRRVRRTTASAAPADDAAATITRRRTVRRRR